MGDEIMSSYRGFGYISLFQRSGLRDYQRRFQFALAVLNGSSELISQLSMSEDRFGVLPPQKCTLLAMPHCSHDNR